MDEKGIARIETPITEIEKMAGHMVKSQLFGLKTEAQAVALMLISQAEGLHPAIAARDYHIIQGRHTLKSDAMLARFQQSGGKVQWTEYTDLKVSGTFSHPQSPTPVVIEWDMNRAKQANLGTKDNWKKYPRQMLKARVVSDGVRLCFPGCVVGVYTPEEVQDFEPVIDVTNMITKSEPKKHRENPEHEIWQKAFDIKKTVGDEVWEKGKAGAGNKEIWTVEDMEAVLVAVDIIANKIDNDGGIDEN